MRLSKYKVGVIASVIVIILIVIIVILAGSQDNSTGLQKGVVESNGNVDLEKQVQASLNSAVEAGMSSIFISTNIQMKDKESPAKLLIQNNPDNNYAQQIRIIRNDTSETIYESPVIDPGYKIQQDYLSVELEKGEYECMAEVNLLSLNDYSLVNTINVAVTLNVKS